MTHPIQTWAVRGGKLKRRGHPDQDPNASPDIPFYGLAFGANEAPSAYETSAGRPAGVQRLYANSGNTTDVTSAINLALASSTAHRVPWVSFPWPSGVDSTSAKTGAADTWAIDIVTRLGAAIGPVMLTFEHEGNLNTKDSTLGLDYALAHDHVYQACTGISANVKIGPIFTGYEVVYRTDTPHLAAMWPGTVHEDFLGVDAYNYYLTARGGSFWFIGTTYWSNPGIHAAEGPGVAEFAASKGVKWAVGEYGISAGAAAYNRSTTGGNPTGTTGGDVTWLREAYQSAVDLGGCLALCYFDTGFNSTTNVASTYTPSGLVGQPAWPLSDHSTWLADTGNPSKKEVFLDLLTSSIPWRAAW
jgi:hypothetical protein